MKTFVAYWKYHDGKTVINPGNPFGEFIPPHGWTCWVYPENDQEFEIWMEANCPTADCTHRFNNGNPMYSVRIEEYNEAMLFKAHFGVGE